MTAPAAPRELRETLAHLNHGKTFVCWLCSDKVPWWREARIKAGLPAEPPLRHYTLTEKSA